VTFGEYRENVELPMYQLVDGVPVLLGKPASDENQGGE